MPIAYSKGFNPHQLMSFALPLSLGVAGLAEVVEIELKVKTDEGEIIKKLNDALPKGLIINEVRLLSLTEKSAASTICSAVYEIVFPFELENSYNIIQQILSESEILVFKKTKREHKEVNIRENIISLDSRTEHINGNKKTIIQANISAGSQKNLKVDIISNLICERAGINLLQIELEYIRVKFNYMR